MARATSNAQTRRDEIVRLATTTGLANVEELSSTFQVTPSTIRRDLAHLDGLGLLARTYGGARALGRHHEPSFSERSGEAFAAKRAIARWAASEVSTDETLLLDAGSTVGALARELREVGPLTVATTGLTTLEELADVDEIHVECLGGTLRHLSRGFVGPLTEAALERMTFDRVFLGADGVNADGALNEADLQQTRLKELMAARAERTYVLAHADKLGGGPFHAWIRLTRPWTLVTDDSVRDDVLAEFVAHGNDIVVVDPDGRSTDRSTRPQNQTSPHPST